MADRQLAKPEHLQPLGLVQEMEQILSAQFIVTGEYGTRCTTTLWTGSSGAAHWRETSFDRAGEETTRREYTVVP